MSRLTTHIHPLLTKTILHSLFSKSIYTTVNFIETDVKQLAIITNLTYKNILVIRKHIINKHSGVTRNGFEYFNELVKCSAIIPTEIKSVDAFLEGGLLTGNIYEICGLPGCGKTQFCLTLTKNCVQNLGLRIYYLDTKRDFNARRIKMMLDADKINEVETGRIMSKILVKQINTKYELLNTLYEIKNEIIGGLKMRLIIIDSLPPLFYRYSDVPDNNGILNLIVNIMRLLSVEYHITFLITNIITTWYEGSFGEVNALTEKIGFGKYWSSVPNTRLKMSKNGDNEQKYELLVLKSNKLTQGKVCHVSINDSGIM